MILPPVPTGTTARPDAATPLSHENDPVAGRVVPVAYAVNVEFAVVPEAVRSTTTHVALTGTPLTPATVTLRADAAPSGPPPPRAALLYSSVGPMGSLKLPGDAEPVEVDARGFSLSLQFGALPARIRVPFGALLRIADTGAAFALDLGPADTPTTPAVDTSSPPDDAPPDPPRDPKVVAFRKR